MNRDFQCPEWVVGNVARGAHKLSRTRWPLLLMGWQVDAGHLLDSGTRPRRRPAHGQEVALGRDRELC
jgi:hypothetical protein